jgi:single-strand DNA-binding protein
MFHEITLVGHLGRDPEMRYTPDGQAVTSFSVAVQAGFGENKKTLWFRVSAWGKTGEACNQYLTKGSKCLVVGRLTGDANGGPRVWQDQQGASRASFEVTAREVRFLSSRGETGGDAGEGEQVDAQPEDDIPF